ncbi:hypothetical protein [Kitasatospora mediocidica]|uniref:hypothetical protein n=1 Tax=Kitasatospora mediocidica TaxID=58352 RepID=UPI00055D6F10|nr:hypothetical protein [Kitasatospora mediocidica]
MGIFDRFKEKADDAVEQAKSALGGHKDKASDGMGEMTGKSRQGAPDPADQAAAHDMDSEGGHEPM